MKNLFAWNHLLKKFSTDIKDKYQYHFKAVNPSDYELNLTYTAKSKILDKVFNQIKKKLGRKHTKFSKLTVSDPKHIEKFEVPENLLNRVHTSIKKNIKDVARELQDDDIVIIRSKATYCVFERIGEENLTIKVKVEGQYGRR